MALFQTYIYNRYFCLAFLELSPFQAAEQNNNVDAVDGERYCDTRAKVRTTASLSNKAPLTMPVQKGFPSPHDTNGLHPARNVTGLYQGIASYTNI